MPRSDGFCGSRKHVLDWTASPDFSSDLERLVAPVRLRIEGSDCWMPRGHKSPREARLETFRPRPFDDSCPWSDITGWWLAHIRGANTPNWDFASAAYVDDTPGLVLVEAKAHIAELSRLGKSQRANRSTHSAENHAKIAEAIAEACSDLRRHDAGVNIQRDSHYQFSNRIAFAWRLASLGVPTILVYLGFLGDEAIAGPDRTLKDDAHWQAVFRDHSAPVWPNSLLGVPVATKAAPFWLLVRSRQISLG
jgi:hypothetical protein